MTRAIALHGVPYFDNGPADQFLALRSPFNLYSHGHLWGIYGPVYPYFAALPFLLGGLRLASVATCMLLIPLALLTFVVTRRLLTSDPPGVRTASDKPSTAPLGSQNADRDEGYATAAAILVVVSTPALGKAIELSAYPLAMVLAVGAVAVTLEAVRAAGHRRFAYAAVAGVLFAAGTGTHLLCLPMSMALIGTLAICDGTNHERGPTWVQKTVLRSLLPTPETVLTAGVALGVMSLLTLPLAYLNHFRFGSYNPFSYGPVPWFGMDTVGGTDQTIASHVKVALPCLLLVLWGVTGWLGASAVKRRWHVRAGVVAVAVAALVVSPVLREKTWTYATVAFAFVFDQSLVTMPWPYRHAPGTFANLHGQWAVKSTLQCTPILLVGLMIPRLSGRAKQNTLVVLAPCAALYVYLVLRGNLPMFSALGIPYAYIRYTTPGLPLLLAAAMRVVRDSQLKPRHAIVAGCIGTVMVTVLFLFWSDEPLYRQVLVLIVPVTAAVVSSIAVVMNRRGWLRSSVVVAALTATLGIGIGIGIGHDFRSHLDGKRWCDGRSDAMRRATPSRFAMFGYHPALDPVLAVSLERDVEYADLAEGARDVDHWAHVRPLLDYWFANDRPVYFVANDEKHKIPWPDMHAELVDRENLIYIITKRATGSGTRETTP